MNVKDLLLWRGSRQEDKSYQLSAGSWQLKVLNDTERQDVILNASEKSMTVGRKTERVVL